MSRIQVDIVLSPDDLELAYMGVEHVYCHAQDGRSIRFPVRILWPFITHNGIHGSFEIEFDQHGKFQDIRKLN